MTLATVPRYDDTQVSERGGRAVVLGASMAGLFAARVLADGYESVTVVERDPLPDDPEPRRGVPQSSHPHVLLEAGRATIEDLFPGYSEDLLSAGGLVIDIASDFDHYVEGGFLEDGPRPQPMYAASRPLFERTVRRRVADLDGVEIRADCQFTDYLVDDGGTTVEGVTIRNGAGEEALPADLVVDATGRTSRTPRWLEEHGYASPPVEEVEIDIAYSTAVVERPPGDRRTLFVPTAPPNTRGGGAFPVEGDRWVVNLHGVHGDHPPADPEGIAEFAATLPTPTVKDLLDEHALVSADVHHHPFPSNRRNHYENLDRFPDGLAVIGDAITSFNPIYGQGMSVAALEALQLHHTLAAGRANVAPRFFERAAEVVDVAWLMATGADLSFAGTDGSPSQGVEWFNRYLSRLARKAHSDGALTDAYYRVIMMERPPTSLLRPGVAWRTLTP